MLNKSRLKDIIKIQKQAKKWIINRKIAAVRVFINKRIEEKRRAREEQLRLEREEKLRKEKEEREAKKKMEAQKSNTLNKSTRGGDDDLERLRSNSNMDMDIKQMVKEGFDEGLTNINNFLRDNIMKNLKSQMGSSLGRKTGGHVNFSKTVALHNVPEMEEFMEKVNVDTLKDETATDLVNKHWELSNLANEINNSEK